MMEIIELLNTLASLLIRLGVATLILTWIMVILSREGRRVQRESDITKNEKDL